MPSAHRDRWLPGDESQRYTPAVHPLATVVDVPGLAPSSSAATAGLASDAAGSLPQRNTLAPLRNGGHDPTTVLTDTEFWRATLTPDGPGTLRLTWASGRLAVKAWGPGADWLAGRVDHLVGRFDPGHRFADAHPAIMRAQHHHPDVRLGASGMLYHELLPTILAQRISGGEAVAQWRLLCLRLGEPAPGPLPGLRLPPCPERLAGMPSWWFHPLGIERSHADTLRTVARHAPRLWEWAKLPAGDCAQRLVLLRGVGEWTIGTVLASALGEPDAVAVGDYHLKNIVAHALTGRARGTDDEMVRLLQPYRGQRGRVVKLLVLDGHHAPKFGPRQRILPMRRW